MPTKEEVATVQVPVATEQGPRSRRSRPDRDKRELTRQRELFLRVRDSEDRAALAELTESFTPLARSLARRYRNTSEPYEDLCQVAQLGLLKAIQRFDPDRGFPFQAFAVPTILGELRRHFRGASWAVHVPRGTQERALEVRDVERALTDEYGRSPTVTEVAQFMELDTEQVLDAMHALRAFGSVSLDAPRAGDSRDEETSYAETIGEDDPRFELVELEASLSPALRQLEPRQRELLQLRYIEEMTQSQIAARIGVSQMQVSRLLQRCVSELRELTLEPSTA